MPKNLGETVEKLRTIQKAAHYPTVIDAAIDLLTEQDAELRRLTGENAIRLNEAINACNRVAEQDAELATLRAELEAVWRGRINAEKRVIELESR